MSTEYDALSKQFTEHVRGLRDLAELNNQDTMEDKAVFWLTTQMPPVSWDLLEEGWAQGQSLASRLVNDARKAMERRETQTMKEQFPYKVIRRLRDTGAEFPTALFTSMEDATRFARNDSVDWTSGNVEMVVVHQPKNEGMGDVDVWFLGKRVQ